MKFATTAKVLTTLAAILILVVDVAAKDPIFVKWLVIDDPGDQVIRSYWERAELGELDASQLTDLGTMLFYRGWPNDAVTYLRQATKSDKTMSEPWFRIGLVKHYQGDLSGARSAYTKCLKMQSGHGWANFYLGLLEEQTGDARSAMQHFETAFEHAPELTDPKVNPLILSSDLQLGAQVRHFDRQRVKGVMPMPVLDKQALRQTERELSRSQMPAATATPVAALPPTPHAAEGAEPGVETGSGSAGAAAGAATAEAAASRSRGSSRSRSGQSSGSGSRSTTPDPGSTPYGFPTPPPSGGGTGTGGDVDTAPQIGDTSPEAMLRPIWPRLHELAEAMI
jgi:tetratricopeptide (TPR) repeat protein